MNSLQNTKFLMTDISDLNKVFPPIFYKDSKNIDHQFKHLNKTIKAQFKNLLQFVSSQAILNSKPFFKKYHCDKTFISILNYTNYHLNFSKRQKLYVNNEYVTSFTTENCHTIAYHTFNFPEIICLEIQGDNCVLVQERSFIMKIKNQYKHVTAEFLNNTKAEENLLSQIPTRIDDIKTYISTNLSMSILIQKIPPEAVLNPNPSLLQFHPRKLSGRFTLLNHTNQVMTFDVMRSLRVNGNYFKYLTQDDCQVIAYHLEDDLDVICFEQRDEGELGKYSEPRKFSRLVWKNSSESKYMEIFKEIHQNWAFNSIWKGFYDNHSFLYKHGVPKAIIRKIIMEYLLTLSLEIVRPCGNLIYMLT